MHLKTFETHYVPLYVEMYVTGGLIGFKFELIPGTCHDVPSTKESTATGEASVIGQRTCSCSFLEDNGELCTLKTLMSCVPIKTSSHLFSMDCVSKKVY